MNKNKSFSEKIPRVIYWMIKVMVILKTPILITALLLKTEVVSSVYLNFLTELSWFSIVFDISIILMLIGALLSNFYIQLYRFEQWVFKGRKKYLSFHTVMFIMTGIMIVCNLLGDQVSITSIVFVAGICLLWKFNNFKSLLERTYFEVKETRLINLK
jgi:hypothetical protein